MKALIIEDEPFARQELKRLLQKVSPQTLIIGEVDSIRDAVIWLKENSQVELIFLDIHLSDGLSFDIFSEVEVNIPVIFTTAYNEYAIQAFRLNSIDYLLKPIEEPQLIQALEKLQQMKNSLQSSHLSNTAEMLKEAILKGTKSKNYKSRFITKAGELYRHIPVDEIAYFKADGNTVYLTTFNQIRSIIDYKLEEIEQMVDPAYFFRASRSVIIHIKAVNKVHKYFNGRLLLEIQPETKEQVTVSRLKSDDFLQWLDQ